MAEDTKEATAAELKKEVAALTKQLATATAAKEAAAGENEQLKQELADTREELATANGIVEEVSQRLANADAIQAESATHVLTFEKKQYRVLAARLQHKGTKYDAKDLTKHPEVLRDLIGDGKGLVQLIIAAKE